MSDIKCIGVLECIGKILDISIVVNTEKEFFFGSTFLRTDPISDFDDIFPKG